MTPSSFLRRVTAAIVGAALAASAIPAAAQPVRTKPPAPAPAGEDDDEQPLRPGVTPPYFPVNASFLFPLSTNFAAPDLWTNFDLALLLGRVGFVDGAQVGVIDWTVHDLRGVQVGVITAVGKQTEGVQLAAGFAFADGTLWGVQSSGLFGWASHSVHGGQIAGVANQTYGDIDGLQAAGVLNVGRKQITGAQVAAGVNIGRVNGFQMGGINVSQNVNGLQIGILNVARRIDGLQIGVINVTDDLQGESLGIIPLPRRGGIHLAAWGSSSLYGNLGIKFASRFAYSIISGALHSVPKTADEKGPRQAVIGAGLTLGGRFPLGDELWMASDVGGYRFFRDKLSFDGHDEMIKGRVLVGYQMAPRLNPFVGVGAFVTIRGSFRDDEDLQIGDGPEFSVGIEF